MGDTVTTRLSEALVEAVLNTSPAQGLTHGFYHYPARFSPAFVRAAIAAFSQPGDVVLDPFMGSATTLVEALIAGRHAIGSDINTLAHFLAQVKTTLLAPHECAEIAQWVESVQERLLLRGPRRVASLPLPPQNAPSQWGIPWSIRQTIAHILAEADQFQTPQQRNLVRCALLRTGQWALDCTSTHPSAAAFRQQFVAIVQEFLKGLTELHETLAQAGGDTIPQVVCLNVPATNLRPTLWEPTIQKKPSLIITSPPYPSVHVLYHRWQIRSRKEVTTPYWITDQLDGHGEAYYTMGSRTSTGLDNYFRDIESSFACLYHVVAENALVVQLLAFSHSDTQLPRYLAAMEHAGFLECSLELEDGSAVGRVWRRVPLRRWYATHQGHTSSSQEVLLIHRRLSRGGGTRAAGPR
jgi:hypothetical protein